MKVCQGGIITLAHLAQEKVTMKETPDYVYHYTSLSTLYHLLDTSKMQDGENIKKSSLCFHATEINAFNDNLEHFQYLKLLNEVKRSKSEDLFEKAINGRLFVVSFSGSENYLPMWKLYANNGAGICLKFNVKEIEETMIPERQEPYEYIKFAACNYEMNDRLKELHKRLKHLYSTDYFEKDFQHNFNDFVDYKLRCAFLKNSSFEYEHEYRLVRSNLEYAFKPTSTHFIPYIEINIPLSCLVEIQTGPLFSNNYLNSLDMWLEPIVTHSNGFDIKIKK